MIRATTSITSTEVIWHCPECDHPNEASSDKDHGVITSRCDGCGAQYEIEYGEGFNDDYDFNEELDIEF